MQLNSYLKLSVGVAVATIALKTGAWWWTGSVSLLSDAMESLVNLAGAMFALAMVTVAARPGPGFGATRKDTTPLPVPVSGAARRRPPSGAPEWRSGIRGKSRA